MATAAVTASPPPRVQKACRTGRAPEPGDRAWQEPPGEDVLSANSGLFLSGTLELLAGLTASGILRRCVPAVGRRILRRMPRLQVYLPEDLYRAVKDRRLPASELLQGAVRAELRRRELLAETDRYLAELVDQVGEPSAAAVARAEALSQRVRAKTRSPKAS